MMRVELQHKSNVWEPSAGEASPNADAQGSRWRSPVADSVRPCKPAASGSVPRHVAIIMDGNRRWARRRSVPEANGHRAGADNVRVVAEACADAGVKYLTLFAFSTENWCRPDREVEVLMDLMRGFLENDIDELHGKEVKLNIVGDRTRFARDLRVLMDRAERITRRNERLFLTIAANYGGRWDITQAARRLAMDARAGRVDPDRIDDGLFASYLNLAALPAPDLCVRTGGDQRISNFLLWDLAYTELYFATECWPDFGADALQRAMAEFGSRQRRFGGRD